MFLGRKKEIEALNLLKLNDKSSLVVCRGRRRIGKSTLIEEFSKNYKKTILIQGISPASGQNSNTQITNFMEQLCRQINIPQIVASSWGQALEFLATFTEGKEILIFLDEISWMSIGDRDFPGKLKIAWDMKLSKNNKLMLVICGSITSWIDKNILNSTNFMGRISLTITLKELELRYLKDFFRMKKLSNFEALKLLSITGGVPRYLEEINPKLDAIANISQLCFRKEGILFNEFEKIFHDIFESKAKIYKEIVTTLLSSALSSVAISQKLQRSQSGVITDYLDDLCESGFLRRSYTWNLKSSKDKKLSKYSISDNYIRFYLKYILPNHKKIVADFYSDNDLPIQNIESILGLQLENLVLNNIIDVVKKLNIRLDSIENFGPYFQNKTNRQESCQIDLLIQTRSSYYICEIKFKKKIGLEVRSEIQNKIHKLKLDKKKNVKIALIYAGELSKEIANDDYLDFKLQLPKDFW